MRRPFFPRSLPAPALEPMEPRLLLAGTVVISEFLAINNDGLADLDGDRSDWIEVRNTAAAAVNLRGWHLTDDPLNLEQWTFPDLTLASGAYGLVFASGKNRAVAGAELHTNFALDGDGEYLALVKPDGVTRTSEYAPEFPNQRTDISFANGVYYLTPTPRTLNGAPVVGFVDDTHFSIDRGFYDAPFTVAITCPTPESVIYYTTDGSAPGPTNGLAYAGPVLIETTTTLRAAAYRTGYAPSNVDTQTYIFLDDVLTQTGAGLPQTWGVYVYDNAGQPVPANYGMDGAVVNDPRYRGTIRDDLRSLPTMSLVLDPDDLWSAQTGIYANPVREGEAWERAASIELIGTDGQTLFQIDAGLRIHGGWGRRPEQNGKHSFRVVFKDDYGATKLDYPLFGEGADDSFDTIVLRAGFNDSWGPGGWTGATYLADRWTAGTQNAMGSYAPHGTFVHLYINGLYWGLYNPVERPGDEFAASYFGGDKEDYDAYVTGELISGTTAAWNALFALIRQPTINFAAVADVLDVPSFIDYLIVNQFGGNWDWPHNNWYATRRREDGAKWQFHSWDGEGCISDPTGNRVSSYGDNGPGEVYQRLLAVSEFRQLFADRVQKHLFNDGMLTPAANLARINALAAQIDRAIVGESARWGDGRLNQVSPDRTRDDTWLPRVEWLRNTYFPGRTATMIGQYRTVGLYPSLAAPTYNRYSGQIAPGFPLTMTAPEGTIYYTLDGADPRLPSGDPSPTASIYGAPVPLGANVVVKSRALKGTAWSALNEATFILDTLPDLRITEIMYNPAAPAATGPEAAFTDKDLFEFVEFRNSGPAATNLAGLQLSGGITFTFTSLDVPAGGYFLVVRNQNAFEARYGTGLRAIIAGQYGGGLNNRDDDLTLGTVLGAVIQQALYRDGWYGLTDGGGFSLVVRNAAQDPDLATSEDGWRTSWQRLGNPGAADAGIDPGSVLINEALTHQDSADGDWVELYNPTGSPVPIGGWYLSDDPANLMKYRVAAGTEIPAGGYRVFTETANFGLAAADPGRLAGFALSELGETVYLTSSAGGLPGGYREDEDFGPAFNGVTFGRYLKSTGGKDFVPMLWPTPWQANSPAVVGPVVINEILYSPTAGFEFIELANLTDHDVPLYDAQATPNPWKFTRGIDFTFPAGAYVPAGGYALVVPVTPQEYRASREVPDGVPVYGPYVGLLDNAGETIQLDRPGAPEPPSPEFPAGYVPYVIVEKVTYGNSDPWPMQANGQGQSLERRAPADYGNDVANWYATPAVGGSPGAENGVPPPAPHLVAIRFNGQAGRKVSSIEPNGNGVMTIEATFSVAVTFQAADVLLRKVAFEGDTEIPGAALTPKGLTGSGTTVLVISFDSGVVVDTWVKVTLLGGGTIQDVWRQALDGEPNPGGSGRGYLFSDALDLPSGNGIPGGDAVFYVGSLRGDMRGTGFLSYKPDGVINTWDINGFVSRFRTANCDADMRGAGYFLPYPDGIFDAWDITSFSSIYRNAIKRGTHLDPLPAHLGPAAPVAPAPLMLFLDSPAPPPLAVRIAPPAAALAAPAAETSAELGAPATGDGLVIEDRVPAPAPIPWSPATDDPPAARDAAGLDTDLPDLLAAPALDVLGVPAA